MTCLRVVLGRYQRRSLTFFAFVQAYIAKVIRYNRHITTVQLPDLPLHRPAPSPFPLHQARLLYLLNPLDQPSLCQLALLEGEAEEEGEVEEEEHQQRRWLQLHPMEACEAYNLQSLSEPTP